MKQSTFIAIFATATVCFAAFGEIPNMPPVKEGLWKVHTVDTYPDQPAQDTTYYLCRNHAYDDSVRNKMKDIKSHCVTQSDTTTGNQRSITMTCAVAGYKTVSHTTVTMAESSFHSETDTTMTVARHSSSNKTLQDQTYEGACPANMSAGDRKLPNGTIQKHR